MAKFYSIDPETCSIDELEKAIEEVKDKEDFYNSNQLGAKEFINSVYGVFGTNFFNLSSTDIAESITLQGQDLIKYSVEQINDYFLNKWNSDIDAHRRIADKMKENFPDFDVDGFLELCRKNVLSFDTIQVYGDTDSISRESIIRTEKHPNGITIEDFYNENKENVSEGTLAGHESVITDDRVYNHYDGENKLSSVKRIIRHKVNKKKYRLLTESGKYVDCSEDHSLVVIRDGVQIVVKPNEIKDDDFIVVLNENEKS